MAQSQAKALFERRWDDLRVASPRKLYRLLDNFLNDYKYEHEYEPLSFEQCPIEGTATFNKSIKGKRDIKRRRRWWPLIVGILLCLLILFIPIGIKLIRMSGGILRTNVIIEVEGEAYRARGAEAEYGHEVEVLDVAADVRVTLKAESGRAKDKEGYEIAQKTKDKKEIQELRIQFEELEKRLGQILPSIDLPELRR